MHPLFKAVKFIVFVTLIFQCGNSAAQKQTSKWFFGLFAGLDFMTNPPTPFFNSAMWSGEGSAGIADAAGNVLFYTDGYQITNRNNVLMANGSGLNGNTTTTQSSLIVKKPGSSNLYFVFTLSPNVGDLKYSVVDMLLAAGDGSVISKNNLVDTNCVEKLAGTMHCNGTDVWVLTHQYNFQDFHAFLCTSAGVNTTAVVSPIGSLHTAPNAFNGSRGQMKLSANGKKLGVAIHSPDNKFEVFDFDNTTGIVTNSVALGTFTRAYGCEFSPDGTVFYGSTGNGPSQKTLHQWNLCAGSAPLIAASLYTIAAPSWISGMQLALNGKIYTSTEHDTLAIINNPSAIGSACNFVYLGQSIFPKTSYDGLPNFVTGLFREPPPPFTYTLDPVYGCKTGSFTPPFTSGPSTSNCAVGYSLVGAQWNFGDAASGSSNTSSQLSPSHSFANYGTYTVQLVLYYTCGGAPDTLRQVVNVVPLPPLSISLSSGSMCAQSFYSSPNSITFTASGANTYSLATVAPAIIVSQSASVGVIGTSSPFSPSGSSTVTLYGTIGACTATLSTTFSIIPNPVVSIASTPSICAGESYTYNYTGASSYTWTSGTPHFTVYSANGAAVTDPSVTSVFTLYGKAQTGCYSALKTSTLTVNPIPTVSIKPSPLEVCKFETATLQASGATNYLWSPGIHLNTTVGSTVQATAVEDQTYMVVGSALGCMNTAFVTVTPLALPVPTFNLSRSAFCIGDTLTLKGLGGIRYEWYAPNALYFQGSPVTITAYDPSYAGEYKLIVTDDKGCKGSSTLPININPLPDGKLSGDFEGCAPLCGNYKFVSTDMNNSVSSWTIGDKIFNDNFNYCFTDPGKYSIKGLITDLSNSCRSSQIANVIVYEKPNADFTFSPEKPREEVDEVLFLGNSSDQKITDWKWFMNEDVNFSSSKDRNSYTFPKAGNYAVVLVVKNDHDCIDTAIKEVKIETDFTFYVPDAFTPNRDGKNEIFKPILNGVRLYNLQIFDRWGERLFLSEDAAEGWDGSFKSHLCEQDNYIWKVILTTTSGDQKDFVGQVLLIR